MLHLPRGVKVIGWWRSEQNSLLFTQYSLASPGGVQMAVLAFLFLTFFGSFAYIFELPWNLHSRKSLQISMIWKVGYVWKTQNNTHNHFQNPLRHFCPLFRVWLKWALAHNEQIFYIVFSLRAWPSGSTERRSHRSTRALILRRLRLLALMALVAATSVPLRDLPFFRATAYSVFFHGSSHQFFFHWSSHQFSYGSCQEKSKCTSLGGTVFELPPPGQSKKQKNIRWEAL